MRGSDQPCRSMASSLKNLNLKQLHPLKSFDAGCVPADVAPDSFAWRFLTALSYHGKRNVRRLATTIMHRLKSLGGQPILDCCNVSCPCTSMLLCHCGPNSSERRLLLRLDCLSMCFFLVCVCVKVSVWLLPCLPYASWKLCEMCRFLLCSHPEHALLMKTLWDMLVMYISFRLSNTCTCQARVPVDDFKVMTWDIS